MTASDRLARFNKRLPNRVIGLIAGRQLWHVFTSDLGVISHPVMPGVGLAVAIPPDG